jgi:hypothetical protein
MPSDEEGEDGEEEAGEQESSCSSASKHIDNSSYS